MLTPETRLEHWLAAIRDALGGGGGGGDDPQTYTVSGEGVSPVAIPEGLNIPTTMTEGFTGSVTFDGWYDDSFEGYDNWYEVGGEVPLTSITTDGGNTILTFSIPFDPDTGDTGYTLNFMVADAILATDASMASTETTEIVLDNAEYPFTYTITFTDAR